MASGRVGWIVVEGGVEVEYMVLFSRVDWIVVDFVIVVEWVVVDWVVVELGVEVVVEYKVFFSLYTKRDKLPFV